MRSVTAIAIVSALAACGAVTVGNKANEPTITSLSPDHGSVIGGTMVTMTGTNFASGTAYVLVGGHLATNTTVTSSTTITFVAPAGDQEGAIVDIELSTSNGLASKSQVFTYNFQPIVQSISPAGGKLTGGTMVTITGRGFMNENPGTPTVTIAGGTATGVQVTNDTTLTATVGAAAANTPPFVPVDVTVANANGSGTLAKAFSLTKQGLLVVGPSLRCCGASNVTFVDPVAGSSIVISQTVAHVKTCALSPSGQLFVMTSPVGNSSTVARSLETLDPLTGITTLVGPLQTGAATPVAHNLNSLTFNNGTLFGVDTGNRSPGGVATRLLYSVNTTNGQLTAIGATAMAAAQSHAITSDDASNVFIADTITGTLDTVNTTTGTRTAGRSMTGGVADSVKGLVNTGSGLFIASQNAPGNVTPTIYSVTIGATIVLTQVAQLTGSRDTIAGLCQTPPSF